MLFFVLKPKNKIDIILNVLKLAIIIVVLLLTSYLSYIVITKYRHYRMENEVKKARLAFNPVIAKIEPLIVYHGTKIIIFGRNFGWKENQKVRLLSTYGEVTTDLWTDGKIIFTIPLHWKMGKIGLWVEKQAEWERKRIIAKSAVVKLKLIPITDKFTPDDDSYFEQLKTLEKETLQLNGYKDVR